MLVIDEVYSLSKDLFDETAKLARELRKLNSRFFLLCVGDFMQLPPVGNDAGAEDEGSRAEHLFTGTEWREFPSLLLTEIVRQGPSDKLAEFATLGWVLEPTDAQLNRLVGIVQGLVPARQPLVDEGIRYCACLNKDVKGYNNRMEAKLRQAGAKESTFHAIDSGDSAFLSDCPLQSVVTFMVGMIVMLVVNLDTQAHFVNGLIGRVVDVDATSITVEFFGGRVSRRFKAYQFDVVDWVSNQVMAFRSQIPFVPAFCLTVHKQQGSTVREEIRIDLRNMGGQWTDADRRAFLYVACTRPVSRDLLVLNLTKGQQEAQNLKRIFRAGLDMMKDFVAVLKQKDILSQPHV